VVEAVGEDAAALQQGDEGVEAVDHLGDALEADLVLGALQQVGAALGGAGEAVEAAAGAVDGGEAAEHRAGAAEQSAEATPLLAKLFLDVLLDPRAA
jgi:hypothetical protein